MEKSKNHNSATFTRKQRFWLAANGQPLVDRILQEPAESWRLMLDDTLIDQLALYQEDRIAPDKIQEEIIIPLMAAFFAKTYPQQKRNVAVMGWIADRYMNETHNGQQILFEDLYKIGEDISYFHALKTNRHVSSELIDHNSLVSLRNALLPFRLKKEHKEKERQDRHIDSTQKNAILSGTTFLYQGDAGKIVIVHTPEACRYWGNNTRWCISKKKNEHDFNTHHKISPIIVLLGKKGRKATLVNNAFWNSANDIIKMPDPAIDALLKEAESRMEQHIVEWLSIFYPKEKAYSKSKADIYTSSTKNDNLNDVEKNWAYRISSGMYNGTPALPENIKNNKDFFLYAVRMDGTTLRFASQDIQKDKEVVLTALTRNGLALSYAHYSLRDDREFILTAIKHCSFAYKYASDSLKKDKEIALRFIKENGLSLQNVDDTLKEDREVVLAALTQDGQALKYAHDDLKKDMDIALAAVQQDGNALRHVSDELKQDKTIVVAAAIQNIEALEHAAPSLRKDKHFILQCQTAVLEDTIARGDIKAAYTIMCEIEPLWGKPDRICGDPKEQLAYLQSRQAPAPAGAALRI